MIAQKEQDSRKKPFNLHGKRSHLLQSELKEYVMSSIPGIGPVVAGNLLGYFGSVEKIMTANREELMKVDRIGSKIAENIRKLAADQL